MQLADFARAVFALVLTLGLIGLAAVALRRYGPEALGRFANARQERLVLLGEGRMEAPLPAPSKAAKGQS
jgi:flagellar protein FliO/FliZ